MSRVLTFSRQFPSYHPRKGQPTRFVEAILTQLGIDYTSDAYLLWLTNNNQDILAGTLYDFFLSLSQDIDPKHHTLRNNQRWQAGNKFSPRVWSGIPYNSKQIIFAPDVEVKKVWSFMINILEFRINNRTYRCETEGDFEKLASIGENDGLNRHDLVFWLKGNFSGQIICWNDKINY